MAEVKIRHAGFVYHKSQASIGPDGKKVTTWHPVMAQRGEVVDIEQESDLENGHNIGAFWTNDFDPETGVPKGFVGPDSTTFSDAQVELSDDVPDVDEATDLELAEWVQKSTVAQVEALATDPDKAARLLEAEEAASGRDPRKTLVEALEKIVG